MWFPFSLSYLHCLHQITIIFLFLSSSLSFFSSPLIVSLYDVFSSSDLGFSLPLRVYWVFVEYVGFCQICVFFVDFCLPLRRDLKNKSRKKSENKKQLSNIFSVLFSFQEIKKQTVIKYIFVSCFLEKNKYGT